MSQFRLLLGVEAILIRFTINDLIPISIGFGGILDFTNCGFLTVVAINTSSLFETINIMIVNFSLIIYSDYE